MTVKRPSQIWIGSKPYSVTYDKGIIDGHNGRERQDHIGRTSVRQMEMTLDDTLAEQVIRETLLHECLHAIWTDAGMDELEGLTEEQIVNCLTPRLVSMMRVNPELMEYMLHSGAEETHDD